MHERRMLLKSAGRDIPSYKSFLDYFKGDPADALVTLITTASNVEPDQRLIEGSRKALEELGFARIQEIDVRNFGFDDLEELILDSQVVFMGGGNTFYLQDALNKIGWGGIIKNAVNHSGIEYIGASAGSAVAGSHIGMSTSENAVGLKDKWGMGIVPFSIASHYTPEKHEEFQERADMMKREPVIAISNTQAILVEGQDFFLVGGDEPVVFNAEATSYPQRTGETLVTRFTLDRLPYRH